MLQVLLPFLGTILDKIFPDAQKSAEAKQKLIEMQINGELQALIGQLEINKEEARSSSVWVSGARPFILWTCGVAFGYATILEPLFRFVAKVLFGYSGEFPGIDTTLTMQVLLGMLGLGYLRSQDKKNGVAS